MSTRTDRLALPGRDLSATVIAWTGYVVYAIPAVLVVPALAATGTRFGIWPTVIDALPATVVATAPLIAWVVYLRRRWRPSAAYWLSAPAAASVLLTSTPLFFWAVPALAVVGMEAVRVAVHRRHVAKSR